MLRMCQGQLIRSKEDSNGSPVMDLFMNNNQRNAKQDDIEAERRLDAIISNLKELSADLDHLLLLGYEIDGLGRNIDKLL